MLNKPFKIFSYLVTACVGIFLLLIIALKWINIPTSAFMLAHNLDNFISNNNNPAQYEWIDIEEIPQSIQIAVIAAEDQKFPSHHGVDFDATQEAIINATNGRPSRGGSTITQQVVKNMFLWKDRSYLRKALEIPLAMLLELVWDKRRILEVYLNIAQFGVSDFGVKTGSLYQLNKPLKTINTYEAALLVAVLPAPSKFKARHPSRRLAIKQAHIIRQLKLIDQEEYIAALK